MLIVKLNTGNDNEERTFNVCDITDYRNLMNTIFDEFQKVLEANRNEDRIELERLVDLAGVSDVDELEDWIKDAYEIKDALDSSDYDSVDEMTERIESLVSTIEEIYDLASSERRNW